MKTFRILVYILFLGSVLVGFSQEKTKKQLRKEQKIEKQNTIQKIVEAKEFQFVARNSNSQYFPIMDLSNNPNFIKFKPDFIQSDLPFFGRGFSGLAYGGTDAGLHFEGKPELFTVEKNSKEYQVKVLFKSQNDYFDIKLSVTFSGMATLLINSNNRGPISYFGEIMPIKEDKKN